MSPLLLLCHAPAAHRTRSRPWPRPAHPRSYCRASEPWTRPLLPRRRTPWPLSAPERVPAPLSPRPTMCVMRPLRNHAMRPASPLLPPPSSLLLALATATLRLLSPTARPGRRASRLSAARRALTAAVAVRLRHCPSCRLTRTASAPSHSRTCRPASRLGSAGAAPRLLQVKTPPPPRPPATNKQGPRPKQF